MVCSSTEDQPALPIRQRIIRDSLLSNYDNCKKLDVFSDPENLVSLAKGELPIIMSGPSADQQVRILMIIPPYVLEGVDKLIPNLIISPPQTEEEKAAQKNLNNFEIARAKKFATSLSTAGLIEKDAYRKILAFYDDAALEAAPPGTD